mmetsp:Transcript_12201/g.22874  ORF Transcript_12201/g.22874 Transcript_12201/m.22874 type:complete len:574 (+) Transcript_12201:118-1839(+)
MATHAGESHRWPVYQAGSAVGGSRPANGAGNHAGAAGEHGRHWPSPVGALLAGLEAAGHTVSGGVPKRGSFSPRRNSLSHNAGVAAPIRHELNPDEGRSRSVSTCTLDSDSSGEPDDTSRERLPRALARAKRTGRADPGAAALQQKLLREGICIDAHRLVLDLSMTLDVFKGILVVLMVTSNVIMTMSSSDLRSGSFASLLICNAASSQCFTGFLIAFGYSCYSQYLREWPDPSRDLERVRWRVLRSITFPIIGAWICNFVWCFLCLKNELSRANVFNVFTFWRVFGNGPDFLCGFSINLATVYALWRPITNLLGRIPPVSMVSYPEWRRDAAALGLALSPLLLSLVSIPDCTHNMRWVQWLLVCDKRDIDTPSLPALPHMMDFGLGILLAACWDRFISDLRPIAHGGPGGALHVLSMRAARHWAFALLAASGVLLLLFVPLGQVWLYTDLSLVQMSTPVGLLVRGFSGGPSALWLLSTLWPVAVWACFSGILVTLRGSAFGVVLKWPLSFLEHLGANVLYYLVIVDIFLAGMFRGFLRVNPFPFGLQDCLLSSALILTFGRFFHLMAKTARK